MPGFFVYAVRVPITFVRARRVRRWRFELTGKRGGREVRYDLPTLRFLPNFTSPGPQYSLTRNALCQPITLHEPPSPSQALALLRFTTAGESHGPALISILEGMPAGLPLLAADVDVELARRQQGYGRGRRMQIEKDAIEFLAGVRAGETIGAPIAMLIRNRDWANWQEIMDPAPRPEDVGPDKRPRKRAVTRVRPGHADLTGLLKFDREDARDILERASARDSIHLDLWDDYLKGD